MRNKTKTIESLRRLAERPGTPHEGETAKRLLEQMGVKPKPVYPVRMFSLSDFPRGTRVFYCYWCYDNDQGTIACDGPEVIQGQIWMRIKFDRLKQPRWVPVTSKKGCHLSTEPFTGELFRWLNLTSCDDLEAWDARLEEIVRIAKTVNAERTTAQPEQIQTSR